MPADGHAEPTHTLVQFSDLHLVAPGQLLRGVLDTADNLTCALDEVERSGLRPDAVVLSGDLADTGDPAAYARLRSIVEPAAERLGAPVLYAMGNHDSRSAMRAGLLGGDASPDPIYYARRLGDLRVVVLDSSRPGHDGGELAAEQLKWLAAELSVPAPAGTVVVLHHPPLPSPSGVLRLIQLENGEALADVLAGTDVKLVTTGHFHHSSAGAIGGVPLWVAGSTAYSIDPLAPVEMCRGQAAGQYTRIDVYPEQAVANVVRFPSPETLYELGLEDFRRYLAAQDGA